MNEQSGGIARARRNQRPYELFMLGLSLYAIIAFVVEALMPLEDASRRVLFYADYVLCALFFLDFIRSVIRAPHRTQYLLTWGWLDFLSSLPALRFHELARAARIARILRVLRAVRSAKTITSFTTSRRSESAAYGMAFLAPMLVVLGSATELHVETGTDSPIRTAADALWWSAGTLTTVGYGDPHPVTAEGRLIGILLMTAGVGLLGTMTGLFASWFPAPTREHQEDDVHAVRKELAALRKLIEDNLASRDG